jgi:hypothetical protein
MPVPCVTPLPADAPDPGVMPDPYSVRAMVDPEEDGVAKLYTGVEPLIVPNCVTEMVDVPSGPYMV